MGAYRQMAATLSNEYKERGDYLKSRLAGWRAEPPVVRIRKPTNIARARELGYKALWVKKSPEGIGLGTTPPEGMPRNRY